MDLHAAQILTVHSCQPERCLTQQDPAVCVAKWEHPRLGKTTADGLGLV